MHRHWYKRARRAGMRSYRGRGRGWGGSRRRRPLAQGELRFAVMKLIEDGPKHGYELIKAIETRTGGVYAPSPGVMYPTLELLVDLGWISAKEEEGKKIFSLTKDGEAALEERAEEAEAVMAKLDALGADEAGEAPDLRTAVRRLNRTLFKRAACGELDRDQLEAMTKIVAEAETKIKDV